MYVYPQKEISRKKPFCWHLEGSRILSRSRFWIH